MDMAEGWRRASVKMGGAFSFQKDGVVSVTDELDVDRLTE